MDKNGTNKRLSLLEVEVAGLKNFLKLMAVADRSLSDQIKRETIQSKLHSRAQKRTLKKAVDAGVNYEERMDRVERQISLLFDSIHRIDALLKTKQDR